MGLGEPKLAKAQDILGPRPHAVDVAAQSQGQGLPSSLEVVQRHVARQELLAGQRHSLPECTCQEPVRRSTQIAGLFVVGMLRTFIATFCPQVVQSTVREPQ